MPKLKYTPPEPGPDALNPTPGAGYHIYRDYEARLGYHEYYWHAQEVLDCPQHVADALLLNHADKFQVITED